MSYKMQTLSGEVYLGKPKVKKGKQKLRHWRNLKALASIATAINIAQLLDRLT